MKIYKAKDYQDMSRKAANIISAQVITKPDCVLGLATGSTPEGMYAQLVEWYKKGDLDFSEVKSVNLDEYRGMTRDNDQSYYYFMHKHLFDHVNIDPANTHLPNGIAEDPQEECIRYENQIKSMGAKTMTYECGMRFLTDYLEGDHYFKVHREGHNLDRCRTQFKLVKDMEEKWDQMKEITAKYYDH